MQTPVLELIRAAMNVNNILFDGEDPDANATRAGLFQLNSMLDSWSGEQIMVYSERNDLFSLVPGQATYAVGPAGNFVMPRPVEIIGAQIVTPANENYPVDVISNLEYQRISDKDAEFDIPTSVGVLTSFPSLQLSFWPKPSTAYQVRLISRVQFAELASVTQIVSLPPGYQEAIVYNLAVRIATARQMPLSDAAVQLAQSSLARVKRNNLTDARLEIPDILGNDPGYINWDNG